MTPMANNTLIPGLVSITFRKLAPDAIVKLIVQGGLRSVEWGGDVHVPHGNLATARAVKRMTDEAGLAVSAYGSYYLAAAAPDKTPAFEAVLDSALALGAPSIRVWAGNRASADADDSHRAAVTTDLLRIAERAARHGVTIGIEYHAGTLTDTPESAAALLDAVAAAPNVWSYWQPRHGLTVGENLNEIDLLRPRLGSVHVFHWWPTAATRLPLADGRERWSAYLTALAPSGAQRRHVLLEFVRGDDEQQFIADAATLRQLISDTSGHARS
jgi:3-dehydroshikimate dehydratase